jgi:hypothetical protein
MNAWMPVSVTTGPLLRRWKHPGVFFFGEGIMEDEERIRLHKVHEEDVVPAVNKLHLLYSIINSDDCQINSDWADDIQHGIDTAVADMLKEVIDAINRFSIAVFSVKEVTDEG